MKLGHKNQYYYVYFRWSSVYFNHGLNYEKNESINILRSGSWFYVTWDEDPDLICKVLQNFQVLKVEISCTSNFLWFCEFKTRRLHFILIKTWWLTSSSSLLGLCQYAMEYSKILKSINFRSCPKKNL